MVTLIERRLVTIMVEATRVCCHFRVQSWPIRYVRAERGNFLFELTHVQAYGVRESTVDRRRVAIQPPDLPDTCIHVELDFEQGPPSSFPHSQGII